MKPVCSSEMAALNRLYKESENIYAKFAASHGISTTTLCILYTLYDSQVPCTQSQLCEDWGIPMQTINSCLKTMEKNGIVLLEFANGSRKSKYVFLTGQGEEMADRIIAPMIQAENAAFSALAEEEQRQLLAITRKHNALLRKFLLNHL